MIVDSSPDSPPKLSPDERNRLHHEIEEACEPIAHFWPMKAFIHHNPLHGLEHLPFDQAIQEATHLLGGTGYLPNDEYRHSYQQGRMTPKAVTRALERLGPRLDGASHLAVGDRRITAVEVWRCHVVYGIEALEPALWEWTFTAGDVLKRFRDELPADSQERIIQRTIQDCEHCRDHPEQAYLTNLWKSLLSVLQLTGSDGAAHPPGSPEAENAERDDGGRCGHMGLPAQRTMSDWVDALTGGSVVEQMNHQMIKWIAAFVDEGLAGWGMPVREQGFYGTWRDLAQYDYAGGIAGIAHMAHKIRALPSDPLEAIVWSLRRMEIPRDQWRMYFSRQLAQLSGWAGFIRWRGDNPDYPAQREHPINPLQYLAVRLFYEREWTQRVCRQEWGIDATVPSLVAYWQSREEEYARRMGWNKREGDSRKTGLCSDAWRLFHLAQFLELSPIAVQDLSASDARMMLEWLDAFPSHRHGPVWLEAYETTYREQLLAALSAHRGTVSPVEGRPRAQVILCIDVRSESFRRHLEAQGHYQTFGFAGFFGIPIRYQAFDSEECVSLCPVLLTPDHVVKETPRPGSPRALSRYASGTRWRQLWYRLFHELKQHPVGSLMLVDLMGLVFSLGLLGKTMILQPYHALKDRVRQWMIPEVPTHIPLTPPSATADRTVAGEAGFPASEQAVFVENGLRTMGLTGNFGRLIVVCGHGSRTENNPYGAALDCGACGGNHGDPNARVFAAMGNNPEVRKILKDRDFPIPDDTWFLAAKHNTTTDEVTFYDVEDMPANYLEDFQALVKDCELASANQALERCHRLPGAPAEVAPSQAWSYVRKRSIDWADPRPEWGLSGNAAFIIGRRSLTKGLDLGGRAFLHSYDPLPDVEGAILEKIMTAPLIVGEWINMEHYFSATDPWAYGSGSKVIHNVVAGIGVMLGSQSDLQTGLPVQTVNDGSRHYHEPMRLLTIIEAPMSRISTIIHTHQLLQRLFFHQWVNLVALDPETGAFHGWHPNGTWEAIQGCGTSANV